MFDQLETSKNIGREHLVDFAAGRLGPFFKTNIWTIFVSLSWLIDD